MELTPRRVLLIGCAISCITIPQYILYQPGSDAEAQQRQRGDAAAGYWGAPDGEFNWCEEDYRLSSYIAEPVNTASGSLYLVIWVAGEGLQRGPVFRPSFSSRLVLVFAGMIGVGTVLFHASLRYTPQLMDELPIFYLLLHTAVELYYRDRPAVPAHAAAAAAAGALAISAGLFSTAHGSIAHDAWRGIMMVPFCGGFLYTFYGTSAAMGEMEAAMLAPGGAATGAEAAAARKQTRALFGHATGLFRGHASPLVLSGLVDNDEGGVRRSRQREPLAQALLLRDSEVAADLLLVAGLELREVAATSSSPALTVIGPVFIKRSWPCATAASSAKYVPAVLT